MPVPGSWDLSPPSSPSRGTARASPWSPSPPPTKETPRILPKRAQTPWTKGYFAFPPTSSPSARIAPPPPSPPSSDQSTASESESSQSRSPPESAAASAAAAAEARRARTAALVAEGERAWVRSGGYIRDALGRVNHERTNALRAEIAAADALAAAQALWNSYEERWRILLREQARGEVGALRWEDVPWPTREATERWMRERERAGKGSAKGVTSLPRAPGTRPLTAPKAGQPSVAVRPELVREATKTDGVVDEAIEEFLFEPLSLGLSVSAQSQTGNLSSEEAREQRRAVRNSKAVHHRVRREMLHWHSDKFDLAVLARVPEDGGERARVKEDAQRVWRWLSAHIGRSTKGNGS